MNQHTCAYIKKQREEGHYLLRGISYHLLDKYFLPSVKNKQIPIATVLICFPVLGKDELTMLHNDAIIDRVAEKINSTLNEHLPPDPLFLTRPIQETKQDTIILSSKLPFPQKQFKKLIEAHLKAHLQEEVKEKIENCKIKIKFTPSSRTINISSKKEAPPEVFQIIIDQICHLIDEISQDFLQEFRP